MTASARYLTIVVLIVLPIAALRQMADGGEITVKYTEENGDKVIKITGDQKNRIVAVVGNKKGGARAAGAGTTDGQGTATIKVRTDELKGADSVDIITSVPGNDNKDENFTGLGQDGTYTSLEQKEKAKRTLLDTDGPLVGDSSGYYFNHEGIFINQFEIVNSSLSTAYQLTSIRIYTGLELAFFSQPDFDSPLAIASGDLALALDGVPGSGIPIFDEAFAGIGPSGMEARPVFTISVPLSTDLSSDHYNLLVGEAAEVLADGSLGMPVRFAIASQAVPEPGALILGAVGLSLFLITMRNRVR